MTEQDLWRYRDTLQKMQTASERLREYESTLLSPASPNLGAVGGHTYRTDRMALAVSYLEKLRSEKYKAESEHWRASIVLDYVSDRMKHISERRVLELRYRQAKDWSDVAEILNVARSTVFEIRLRILASIADLDIDSIA